jgi:Family of unknown function (DUF6410)
MQTPNTSQPNSRDIGRDIGPIGTSLRVALAIVFLALLPVFGTPRWWQVGLGVVVFPAVLVGWLALYGRVQGKTLRPGSLDGHLTFVLFVVVPLVIEPTRNAAVVFVSASMLVAALRGYAGCEVSALGNLLLHRRDQIFCPVFLPLDLMDRLRARRSLA